MNDHSLIFSRLIVNKMLAIKALLMSISVKPMFLYSLNIKPPLWITRVQKLKSQTVNNLQGYKKIVPTLIHCSSVSNSIARG